MKDPQPKKHVYDHKRRVKAYQNEDPLSDDNLTPNEEELLKIIEGLEERLRKLEDDTDK
ncbi:MAG: hypothetical protein JAY74_07715 [Candidatus Thiodiazotropha taylori]|nr:hypothetical protein [Candidatus Thiodiazotropha taylori]